MHTEEAANDMARNAVVLHASAVSIVGCGVVLTGASGAGKSSLALELMAFGAGLIADDRALITRTGSDLVVAAPATLPAMIEARGVGLLPTQLAAPAPLRLIVDLSRNSSARFPQSSRRTILGVPVKLLTDSRDCPMAAAILQLVRGTADWTCD